MRWPLAAVVLFSTQLAFAERSPEDQAKDLAAAGNEAAEAGNLTTARDHFRAAIALDRRAAYMCNLGMAHYGLDDLVRAQPYLDRCAKERRVSNPEILEVLSYVTQTLTKSAKHVLVELETSPQPAWIEVDVLRGDPLLEAPVALYVPVGVRRFRASLDGHSSREVDFTASVGGNNHVKIDLAPLSTPNEASTDNEVVSTTPSKVKRSSLARPWLAVAGGAGFAIAGGVFHGLSLESRDAARDATERDPYEGHVDDLKLRRGIALGFYGVGAALGALGVYLLWRSDQSLSEGVELSLSPSADGLWASGRIEF